MTWRRLIVGTAVAALAATALLLGGVLRESSTAAPASLAAAQSAEDFKEGFSLNGSTASLVAELQSRLEADPKDEHSYALLGLAYQQRARETGDPSWYPKAEGALRRALGLDPKDSLAVGGLGSLALSRHRFRAALALGRQAHALNPYSAQPHGVIGDAQVELGRYAQAFASFDRMNGLRPNLASYARVSYGRELLGHTAAAIRAMKLAVDAATGAAEPTAWTHVQLGKLYFNHGRYADAEREYRLALRVFPGYAYGLDALAQVLGARGRYRQAIAAERRAVDAIPLPQYVAALGDLYRVTGRRVSANRQYDLIGAIEKLLNANGVRTDLEIALFQVDHGIALRHALARARLARAERPSIDGNDVLAWALVRNGRCAEALPYSRAALRLGTQDALKFFHRGMIERCLAANRSDRLKPVTALGHARASRVWFSKALALNPHFSILWAPSARRYAS